MIYYLGAWGSGDIKRLDFIYSFFSDSIIPFIIFPENIGIFGIVRHFFNFSLKNTILFRKYNMVLQKFSKNFMVKILIYLQGRASRIFASRQRKKR